MERGGESVHALVEEGRRHHFAGRFEEAKRCYREALERDPRNPDALGMAGALALQLGDPNSASRLLEKSLALAPGDAGRWNDLGAARAMRHDRTTAEDAYRRAISLDPRQFDAHHNLGSLLLESGDADAAVGVLGRALALRPDDAGCQRTFAAALREAGDPWRAAAELAELEAALGADPDFWGELAECRAMVGDHPGAEHAWRRLLALREGDRPALAGLASALAGRQRYTEASAVLAEVLERVPGDADLWLQRGNTELAAEDLKAAARAFEQALEIRPGHSGARLNLGIVRLKQGRSTEADRHFAALEGSYHTPARLAYFRALVKLEAGGVEDALAGFERSLAFDPLHVNSIWYRHHCLRELGRDGEARAIMDPARDPACLEPLEGLPAADREAFLGELTRFVTEYPHQWWEPAGKTTRGGHQTPSLPLAGEPVMRRFESLVREAVDAYLSRLPASHVIRANWPGTYRLDVWGTLLRRGGHQKPHIHPGGMLSGVFYASLPKPDRPEAGWIEFGGAPYDTATGYAPWTRRLEPRPGRLVIFPAYLPHSTVPFDSDHVRVSVAFDVSPPA